jgi:hypothetical protein
VLRHETYPVDTIPEDVPSLKIYGLAPFVLTPLNINVILLTQLGIPVKSMDVPEVLATAVPLVKGYSIPVEPATVLEPVIAPVTPSVLVNVPVVPDTAPVAARVPVTVAPVDVTATTVVPLLFKLRMPEASPVIEMPPAPLVRAAIVDAIYIS